MNPDYVFGIGAAMTLAAFYLVIKPVSGNKLFTALFWILGNIIFIGTVIYWSQEGHHSMMVSSGMLLFMNVSTWALIKRRSNKINND